MCGCGQKVDLGFTPTRYPRGAHICHLYSDDAERRTVLDRFLAAGLKAGEMTACVSDELTLGALAGGLQSLGVDAALSIGTGDLTVMSASEFYFEDDVFDPDALLDALREFHDRAVIEGYRGSRVIGEMPAEIQVIAGGERLGEYEARVNLMAASYPVTAICQYDMRHFRGDLIMDVLAVHPLMIRDGAIVENPSYIRADDYLRRRAEANAA